MALTWSSASMVKRSRATWATGLMGERGPHRTHADGGADGDAGRGLVEAGGRRPTGRVPSSPRHHGGDAHAAQPRPAAGGGAGGVPTWAEGTRTSRRLASGLVRSGISNRCHTPVATVGPMFFHRCAPCVPLPGPVLSRPGGPALMSHRAPAAAEGLDGCASLLDYRGTGRDLILALKYGNHRGVVASARAGHGGRWSTMRWASGPGCRRRPAAGTQRGYDQARLLAREVARALGTPCQGLLRRASGPAETWPHPGRTPRRA